MTKQAPIAVYRGGTFKEEVRNYSNQRMDRDPAYRRSVRKAVAEKRAKHRQEKTDAPVN